MADLPTIFRRRPREQGTDPRRDRTPRFWYKDAGQNMPAEVRMALARFRQLPEKVRAQIPLWGWLIGGGTPVGKMEQSEVQYGPPPSDKAMQRCHNCIHFYRHETTGVQICAWVKGVISPTAWCNKWAAPISRKAYVDYQQKGR